MPSLPFARPSIRRIILAAAGALVLAPGAARAQTGRIPGYFSVTASALSVTSGGNYTPSASASSSGNGATAAASASLADGKLHASVATDPSGTSSCPWWEGGWCTWGGNASASIWDVVTVNPSEDGSNEITWSFDLDGGGNNGNWYNNGWWSGYTQYLFSTDQPTGIPPYTTIDHGGKPKQFHGSVTIDRPTTFYFMMGVSVGAFNGAMADFGNTFKFSWTLPKGATYSSASGEFMTAAPAATTTPEPATWALLGVGLAATGVAARRARRGTA